MTAACDLMIVLGSSLTVYPAAAFPEHVAQRGASLAIVNQQPTGLVQWPTWLYMSLLARPYQLHWKDYERTPLSNDC